MSNYTILQLNAKELSELKDIATGLGLKVSGSAKKETLVYDILDQQAVVNAQRKTTPGDNQSGERKKRLRVAVKKNTEQTPAAEANAPAAKPVEVKAPQQEEKKVVAPEPVKKEAPKAEKAAEPTEVAVITSYSIHYTKLYELCICRPVGRVSFLNR